MNHSGDTNKMVSDTPRTTDRVVFIDGNPWVNAPFAMGLELELNAANDRIKRLEAVVNDPHALWTNWLRGDVKLPAGMGDVRQYQAHIKRLEDRIHRAAVAFFRDGSDGQVASGMLAILEEERRKP